MKYIRICKFCEKDYRTKLKNSKVCPECSKKHHQKKLLNNLFNGKNKNVVFL